MEKIRRRADGPAFEKEFREKTEDYYYVRRLPTLRSYAGLSQPADFILVGNSFNYVELKETKAESFSITSMQQYDEVVKFLDKKKKLEGKVSCNMNYWLIVRFLGKGVCAVPNENILKFAEERKTLKYNSPSVLRVNKIEDLREENIF